MKITVTLDVTQEQLLALIQAQPKTFTLGASFGTNNQALSFLAPKGSTTGRRGRPSVLSDEGLKELWRLHLSAFNSREIATKLGCSRGTVQRAIRSIANFKKTQ